MEFVKSDKPMMFACRLTYTFNRVEKAFEEIAKNCDKVVVYAHNDDCERPHIHFLIENLKKSTDTVKNWIVKALSEKPTKDMWSMKSTYGKEKLPVDYGYITYMSKGKYDPVFQNGFRESTINEYKSKWVEPVKASLKSQSRINGLSKDDDKKTFSDICKDVINHFQDNDIKHPTIQDVVQELQKVLIKSDKWIGRYKFRDLADAIYSRLNRQDYEIQMLKFCEFR